MSEPKPQWKPPSRERLFHRHAGVVMAAFLLLLTVSGIVLNHSIDLELDRSHLPGGLAGIFYGEETSDPVVFAAGASHLIWADGRAWLGLTLVAQMALEPTGVTALDGDFVLMNADEALFITPEGQLIERIDSAFLSLNDATKIAGPLGEVPSAVTQILPQLDRSKSISWQRFLTDLHTGRIFGSLGSLFFDLIALVILAVASTGIVLWLRVRRRQP